MTLQKLRRWLGFPLEDRYRVHIEQDIVQSSLRPGIFSALLILAFQAVMMVLSLLRKGGPFASLRRQGYWWLYVTLFSVTLLFLLLIVFLMRRRRPCLDTFFLPLQTFYTAFLCLWGTCVTLLDQFGGNSLSVFTYVTLSAAALTVLQPWQSALIFTGNCLFLNLLLPYTPAGPDNFYSNAVNSCFVTLGAFFISLWFYRSKVSSCYAKIIIEQQNADIRSMNVQLDRSWPTTHWASPWVWRPASAHSTWRSCARPPLPCLKTRIMTSAPPCPHRISWAAAISCTMRRISAGSIGYE